MKKYSLFLIALVLTLSAFAQRHRKEAYNQIEGARIEHSRKGVDSFREHGWVDTSAAESIGHHLHVRAGLTVSFSLTGFVQNTNWHVDRGTVFGNVTIKNTKSNSDINGIYSIVGTPSFQIYNEIQQKYIDSCGAPKCTWKVVIDNNEPVIVTTAVDKKKYAWVFRITATKVQ